eukprot:11199572-Lingulodinium_polyedra.AAC.1
MRSRRVCAFPLRERLLLLAYEFNARAVRGPAGSVGVGVGRHRCGRPGALLAVVCGAGFAGRPDRSRRAPLQLRRR